MLKSPPHVQRNPLNKVPTCVALNGMPHKRGAGGQRGRLLNPHNSHATHASLKPLRVRGTFPRKSTKNLPEARAARGRGSDGEGKGGGVVCGETALTFKVAASELK